MPAPTDQEAFLAKLRAEYVDGALDRMDRLDMLVDRLFSGEGDGNEVHEIQREIHSMKGSAGTYGFPGVSVIAHRLEDYIETTEAFDHVHMGDLQTFLDWIRSFLTTGEPMGDDLTAVLAKLPSSARNETAAAGFSPQSVRDIHVLLAMPRDIQRKIIGTELAACGLRVAVADTGSAAIARALAEAPDIVVTAMELPDMTGLELSQVFHVLKRLQHCRFMVMTSYGLDAPQIKALPDDVAIVRKGETFIEDLSRSLMEWRILS